MAKLKSSKIYGDLEVTGGIRGNFEGNAKTATKLQTARTINGTNFDGSANITTTNWGTARNLQVGNTSKSVNGSANVAWSLSEIGALPTAGGTMTGSIKFSGGGYNNHAIRMEAGDANGAFIGIGAGGLTVIGSGESTNAVRTALTNGADETMIVASDQAIRFLTGVQNGYDSAKEVTITNTGVLNAPQGITGNASSATKLQTARSINGTNFDGSGNITTANWGTARTLTIGNTGKSVNGSGNVSWSLSEIGAAASSHTHTSSQISDATNANTANMIVKRDGSGNFSAGTISASLNGTATYTNYLNSNTRMEYGWNGVNYFNINGTAGNAAKVNDTPTSAWWHIMRFNHANSSGFYTDLALPFNANSMYYKRIGAGSVQNNGWVKVLDSLNYNEYAPSKTGSGASGTWGISVSGNSATATKLATARTINGTSFDGSGNITTANWGTARTITIGGTGKSVNGSGNVSWSLSEIGAAASSHNHGLLHDNFGVSIADTTTDSGWSMINSSYNGYILKSIRTNASAPAWLVNNYGAGVAFGGSDTKGVLSVAYNSPSIRFAGGNGSKPVWYMSLTGSSGKSYNMDSLAAATATKLATARTINGTSFDGTGNITTANWGTARTITIGGTGKSVNGSGNVSWSLSEIGAAAASHSHSYLPLSGGTLSGNLTVTSTTTDVSGGLKIKGSATSGQIWTGTGGFVVQSLDSANLHLGAGNSNDLVFYSDKIKLAKNIETDKSIKNSLTCSHIDGFKGKAIVSSTGNAGSHVAVAKTNSTKGHFTLISYQDYMGITYATKTKVDGGTNGFDHGIKLLDENGWSTFKGVKIDNGSEADLRLICGSRDTGLYLNANNFGIHDWQNNTTIVRYNYSAKKLELNGDTVVIGGKRAVVMDNYDYNYKIRGGSGLSGADGYITFSW